MDAGSVSSWKKNAKEQVEVDFVWKELNAIPIECKASLKLSNNLSALKYYMNLSGSKVGIVISAASFEVLKQGKQKIINIPIYLANPWIITAIARTAL